MGSGHLSHCVGCAGSDKQVTACFQALLVLSFLCCPSLAAD